MLPIFATGAILLVPANVSLQAKRPSPNKNSSHSSSGTQWGPCQVSAETIAQRTDERLHTIKSTMVTYLYRFHLAAGIGTMGGMAAIKDQQTFRVESPVVGVTEREGPYWEARVASGGKVVSYPKSEQGKSTVGSVPSQISLPSDLVAGWMHGNVRYLFDGVGSNANPLEALVRSVHTTPRYSVKSQQRTISVRGIPVTQYRILVEHDAKAAKTFGELFYEVVIDSKYYLPVSMNNLTKLKGATYFTSFYDTSWNLKPKPTDYPNKSFDIHTAHIETRKMAG